MAISRQEQLSQLREYVKDVDKEVTMILQSLHWDVETLLKGEPMVTCKYDTNHRIPVRKQKEHEENCYIKSQGYKEDELFLPEPLNPGASTLVKFTSDEINQIIDNASKTDPLFKKGTRSIESQPLTADRLTATYTPDERRAIHDAVVNSMPSFHDLSDLALPSTSTGSTEGKSKSRLEVLAELRDMKRRRTKYRVAGAASNYSHTLRELIATQMEHYTGSNLGVKTEKSDQEMTDVKRKDNYKTHGTHPRDMEKYNKRENFENITDRKIKREIHRDEEFSKQEGKYSERDNIYPNKYERKRESYATERDRKYIKHDDRKRHDRYSDSYYSDQRSSSSNDRKRHNDRSEREGRHRSEKHRRDRYSDKDEHRRYGYDGKQNKHGSREKSIRKDYK